MPLSKIRGTLVDYAKLFYQRGWMLGTSGNLSLRVSEDTLLITASGVHKGEMTSGQALLVNLDGEVQDAVGQGRPSAETSIHATVYRGDPAIGACFHVHTVEACLVADRASDGRVVLPDLEMVKGFGIWEQSPQVSLAVLPNHLDVPSIAAELEPRLEQASGLPGFLIEKHGLTVWGKDAQDALKHLELFDFIFRYMAGTRSP